jgi:hypothetical protein
MDGDVSRDGPVYVQLMFMCSGLALEPSKYEKLAPRSILVTFSKFKQDIKYLCPE